jgi:hypothetical protein
MTRKYPNIPVAVMNDDGTSTIADADELLRARRERREAFEAKGVPFDVFVAALVERHKVGGQISTKELLVVLAGAELSRWLVDDTEAKIPPDLLNAIGIVIGGVRSWRAGVAGNRDKAAQLEDVVREKVRERLAKDPSVRAAALAISKDLGGRSGASVRNLRRIVARIKRELAKTQTRPHTR